MEESTIAVKLQRYMAQRGLSPTELSRLSGVPLTTILSISKGDRKNPGIKTIEKLSAALRVSPNHFRSGKVVSFDSVDLPEDLKKLVVKEDFLPYLALGEKAYHSSIPHEVLQKIIDAVIEAKKQT